MTTINPIVIKLGGAPIDAPDSCAVLWRAIADAWAHNPGGLVVVHGGGVAVDRRLAEVGSETPRVNGLRVTDDNAIGVVAGVLAGEVNRAVVGGLRSLGVDAAGVGLSDGGLCRCEAIEGLGRVGRVIDGDPAVLAALLGAGFLPVVHSIGMDEAGVPLNVNADDAASGVARVCGAARLVLVTDVPAVRGAEGEAIEELTPALASALIASGEITTGMAPKVNAALDASAAGAEAVIGSWQDAAGLIAGTPGVGTRVSALANGRRRPAATL